MYLGFPSHPLIFAQSPGYGTTYMLIHRKDSENKTPYSWSFEPASSRD